MVQVHINHRLNGILITGMAAGPHMDSVEHLMPDIYKIHLLGNSSVLLELSQAIPFFEPVRLCVYDSCGWPELLYGCLRFVHGAIHARRGSVVLDAGLLSVNQQGVLILGSGKSAYAAAAARLTNLISDDTVIVNDPHETWSCFARVPNNVRSRTGLTLFPELARSTFTVDLKYIVHVEGAIGPEFRYTANSVDSCSWMLQGMMGKIVNFRSYPNSFAQFFQGFPGLMAGISQYARQPRPVIAIGGIKPFVSFLEELT